LTGWKPALHRVLEALRASRAQVASINRLRLTGWKPALHRVLEALRASRAQPAHALWQASAMHENAFAQR